MKKPILIYGIVGGLISGAWGTVGEHFLPKGVGLDIRTWLGYASMIVAFSLIFVAIKNYKENVGNGQLTFGKALQIGLLVTLVASTVYVAIWLIGYYFFFPNFYQQYMTTVKLQMEAEGKSVADVSQAMSQIAKYNNPFFNALLTYVEIAPVGVVISLLAALILKNNPKSAQGTSA